MRIRRDREERDCAPPAVGVPMIQSGRGGWGGIRIRSTVIVHLNGKLVPIADAAISPLDRGFLFGDGVYEGLRGIPWDGSHGRRIVGIAKHIERMRQGLNLAKIHWDPSPLHEMSIELLKANQMTDAFVYWQATRGTPGPGDPVRSRVPGANTRPTVFGYCTPQPSIASFIEPMRKSAITCEDRRWTMGHLKSVSLMGNVVASMEADAAGAEDAIFVRNSLVAEGLATNVILVDAQGRCATPSLSSCSILAGVTRDILLCAAPEIEQRAVPVRELESASEVLMVGTTTMVASVVKLNGRPVGAGIPGPVGKRLLGVLLGAIKAERDE